MALRTSSKGIAAAIVAMDPDAWVDIDYTSDGVAQFAECPYGGRRLIVRRTRLTGAAQRRPVARLRHFGFLTDLDAMSPRSTSSTATTPPSSWPSAT